MLLHAGHATRMHVLPEMSDPIGRRPMPAAAPHSDICMGQISRPEGDFGHFLRHFQPVFQTYRCSFSPTRVLQFTGNAYSSANIG